METGVTHQGRLRRLLSLFVLATLFLSGCTSPIGPPQPTAYLIVDVDQINTGEPVNFDARSSTTPEGTVVTDYEWEFGDGSSTSTSQGLTSHVFGESGTFSVRVLVINDQGGSDSASWTIHVNAYPQVSLTMPTFAKVGEVITLDANSSHDPDGGVLLWSWDLDWSADSDDDGDAHNDVDSTESSITMMLNESGRMEGSVTVTDDSDASATRHFVLNVSTRTWRVVWEETRISYSWNGYLEQGATWTHMHQPGAEARLISMNATLTLEMDMLPYELPQDNFTLRLAVPSSAWSEEQTTSQENVTKAPKAYLDRDDMNPAPSGQTTHEADHVEDLRALLLDDMNGRFGRGNWTWQVVAEQSDPDFFEGIDPDEGNDWDLEVEFVIVAPRITEVAN